MLGQSWTCSLQPCLNGCWLSLNLTKPLPHPRTYLETLFLNWQDTTKEPQALYKGHPNQNRIRTCVFTQNKFNKFSPFIVFPTKQLYKERSRVLAGWEPGAAAAGSPTTSQGCQQSLQQILRSRKLSFTAGEL